MAAGRGEVAAGAAHRGGIDVRGVQLGGVQGGGERGAHRAGTAAQVDDHRAWRGELNGLADQELGPAAGHEDTGIHGYPQAAEVRPADDLFQGQAGCPPVHHGSELRRRRGRGDEQLRLILGEHATGGPQPGDDGGPGNRGRGDRHEGAWYPGQRAPGPRRANRSRQPRAAPARGVHVYPARDGEGPDLDQRRSGRRRHLAGGQIGPDPARLPGVGDRDLDPLRHDQVQLAPDQGRMQDGVHALEQRLAQVQDHLTAHDRHGEPVRHHPAPVPLHGGEERADRPGVVQLERLAGGLTPGPLVSVASSPRVRAW